MKKLFGGLNLTWPKLIIFAVVAGVYTGVMALLPITTGTSFADISITFEWWVLFGILIIVNSRSPLDSGLKCLVFFLISQPLVYLVQVPFNVYGWGIFRYYPGWFVWTLFTFPMGFIGWYMKKDKWWGLLILVPILIFVGYHYLGFLRETRTYFPNHLLSAIFCAVTVIIYPLFIFQDRRIRLAGLAISLAIVLVMSVLGFTMGKRVYNTVVMVSGGSAGVEFDDTYTAEFADPSFGTCEMRYEENIDAWMVHVRFTKTGDTELILRAPDGTEQTFALHVERYSYDIQPITGASADPSGG